MCEPLTVLDGRRQKAAPSKRCVCEGSSVPRPPRPSAPRQTAGLCPSGTACTPGIEDTSRVSRNESVLRANVPRALHRSYFTHILGLHNAKQWEKQGREQGCNGQGQDLRAPVDSHQDYHVGTFCLLHEKHKHPLQPHLYKGKSMEKKREDSL